MYTKLDSAGNDLPQSAEQWALVRDDRTGLIWSAADSSSRDVTFEKAQGAIANLNGAKFCGFDDWRLPTIQELLSIVDYSRRSPAIDTNFFWGTKNDWYWSSTPAAASPADCAWIVNFNNGNSNWNNHDNRNQVRAVRSVPRASQ